MKPNDIKFCKNRHAQYDAFAKEVVEDWMKALDFTDIQENTAEGHTWKEIWDLKGFRNGVEIRVEAEVKQDWGTRWTDSNWKDNEYPFCWGTMDIPYRKRDKVDVQATHHAIVGGDGNRLFIVSRKVVLESPVTPKPVRNRGGAREPFYNVFLPAPMSMWFEKRRGTWKRIKK